MHNGKVIKKILVPHEKDCAGIRHYKEGWWTTPWAYFEPDKDRRDSLGRKNNGRGQCWQKVVCNDPECPAVMIVSEDAIFRLIGEGK